MPRSRPRVHARDHEHGGADPQRIHYEDVGDSGGGGDGTGTGIQYVTDNEGDWLDVGTDEAIPGTHSGTRFHATNSGSFVVGVEVTAETSASAGEAIGLSVEATPGAGGTAIGIAVEADTAGAYAIQATSDNGTAVQAVTDTGNALTVLVTGGGHPVYVVSGGSIIFSIDPDGHIHGKASVGSITWDL